MNNQLQPEQRDKTKIALKEYAKSLYGEYPLAGAISRHGTTLVRQGLAVRIGLWTYADNSRGELPDRWVRFKLTKSGRKLCSELGIHLINDR